MKKFLSLVLALVMTFSLVTVSAGAKDFTDQKSIKYDEAVNVMSAVKVIDGYANGSFNPSNTLTRGAAAKIICNMILGPTTASALGCSSAPFSDVPANHTFAGYIAYCSSQGIINGYSDGTFKPAATVTGYQFLKMLLGALGYDATIEGFTGSNWSVNVAKLAVNLDLTKGNDTFVGSKAMTREEACLYAFNTMKATMVEYATKGTTITVNGATISTGASKAEPVTSAKDSNTIVDETPNASASAANPDTVQFAEKYFSGLTRTQVTGDDLGRPAHGWQVTEKGKVTDLGSFADEATLVYTKSVSSDDMTKALKGYTYAGTVTTTTNSEVAQATSTSNKTAAAIAALTGNGYTVEIFVDNNAITNIVVIKPKLGEITGVTKTTANKTHGAYNTYTIDTNAATGRIYTTVVDEDDDVDTIVTSAELAKKDHVTYYKGANKLYIDATTSMSGVLSSITNKGVMTIDGTSYDLAAYGTRPSISKKSQDFYVDSLGYVIESFTETSTNYAYVVPGTAKAVMVANSDGTYENAYRATIVLADGSVQTVITSDTWSKKEGTVITYTTNSKDQYVAGSAAGEQVTELPNDQITITTSYKANASTLYVVCNYVDDDDDDTTAKVFSNVTTYVGYKNVPTYGSLTTAWAVDTNSTPDGIADVVFIGDIGASATETGKYVYVKGTYTQTSAGYIFDTIVAGEDSTTTKSSAGALTADTLYSAIGTTDTAAIAAGQKIQNKGGLLYIDGKYSGKTIADDVKVYTINMADDSVTVGTAGDLSTEVDASPVVLQSGDGTRGVYVEYNSANTAASTVYILYNSED